MGYYINFLLKKKIRDRRTIFLILIVTVIFIQNISIQDIQFLNSVKDEYDDAFGIKEIGEMFIQNSYPNEGEYREDNYRTGEYIVALGEKMEKALDNNDYKEYNRLKCIYYLVLAKEVAMDLRYMERTDFYLNKVEELFNKVRKDEIFDDFVNDPVREPYENAAHFFTWYLSGNEYYELYNSGHRRIDSKYMNNSTALLLYFDKLIPIAGLIISILLVFDSINGDIKSGAIKSILTSNMSRNKYIIYNIIASTIYVIIILLIPAILISLMLGIFHKDGFEYFNYPTLYLKNGMSRLDTIPNYLDYSESPPFKAGLRKYNNPSSGYEMVEVSELVFMPLYIVLLLSFFLTFLQILFYICLVTIISSFIENKILSLSISVGTIIGFTYVSKGLTKGNSLNISPFTQNDVLRVLDGTYCSTGLIATIVLVISIIVLISANIIFFKRKAL
jgi:hypothetical protein